jgi:hypothetical protein
VPYRWIVDARDGHTRMDWKWLVVTLVAGVVTAALAILLLPGWVAAVVIVGLASAAIVADVVIRRRTSP